MLLFWLKGSYSRSLMYARYRKLSYSYSRCLSSLRASQNSKMLPISEPTATRLYLNRWKESASLRRLRLRSSS